MSFDEDIGRLDGLLMRVLDGEATEAECAEIAALADADARLAPHEALRVALQEAVQDVAGASFDVVAQVLEALAIEDGWSEVGVVLREGVPREADVADSVMAMLSFGPDAETEVAEIAPSEEVVLSALFDGELPVEERLALAQRIGSDDGARKALSSYAELGRLLRESIAQEVRAVDLSTTWRAVATGIGMGDPEHVEGWEPTAAVLRSVILDHAHMSQAQRAEMVEDVLEAIKPREIVQSEELEATEPILVEGSRLRTLVPAIAMAALALVVVMPFLDESPVAPDETAVDEKAMDEAIEFAGLSHTEVLELEYASQVFVQVIQGDEDDAPVILFVDEDAFGDDALDEGAAPGEKVDTGGAL